MATQDITIFDETGTYSAGVTVDGKLKVDASFSATSIKLEDATGSIINPAKEDGNLASILNSINSLITVMQTNIDGGFAGAVYGATDYLDGGGA